MWPSMQQPGQETLSLPPQQLNTASGYKHAFFDKTKGKDAKWTAATMEPNPE